MKMPNSKSLFTFLFLFISMVGFTQESSWVDFPVTSSSRQVQELYASGLKAFGDVNLDKAILCFQQAAENEPNFIMPNVSLALYYFSLGDMDRFKTCVNKVLKSTYELTESEKLIREALKKLAENKNANVAEYGTKLVELNPDSYLAYDILATFQGFDGDLKGQNISYQHMLEIASSPVQLYNKLGYNYLAQNNLGNALSNFLKYINLAPKNPNAYDSMGDYYFKANDLKKAHIFYIKAYKLDTIHFKISQIKAKKLELSLGN